MNFKELREKNKARCNEYFHELYQWDFSQWTNAMAGEVGEACNFSKKLLRLNSTIYSQKFTDKEKKKKEKKWKSALSKELADVVIYADLIASRLNLKLEDLIRDKFNQVSDELDCPYKLGEENDS